MEKKYDSTIARIAGNVAGQLLDRRDIGPFGKDEEIDRIALVAVKLARAIVREVERAEDIAFQQSDTWHVVTSVPE